MCDSVARARKGTAREETSDCAQATATDMRVIAHRQLQLTYLGVAEQIAWANAGVVAL